MVPPRDLSRPQDARRIKPRAAELGERLDAIVARRYPHRSRTVYQREIRAGRVRVSGRRARPSYRVRPGDVIEIALFGVLPLEPVSYDVLHEDQGLLVINKPPGVICHPVGGHLHNTLMNTLHRRYRAAEPERDVVPRLCHRLDRHTSGVLVVAKDPELHVALQQQFEHQKVRKTYEAVVRGVVAGDRGTIDIPLALTRDHPIRMRMEGRAPGAPDALSARTDYQRLEPLGAHTLLRLHPHQGRQHQIRIHLELLGHPILGDRIYGRPEARDPDPVIVRDGERVLLDRQALHAAAIEFEDPRSGRTLSFAAPRPPDLQGLIEHLREGGRIQEMVEVGAGPRRAATAEDSSG